MKSQILDRLLCIVVLFVVQHTYAQIAITEVYYDTPYDEKPSSVWKGSGRERYSYEGKAHHLGEFIELYNYTNEDIPLKGWSMYDNTAYFHFPDNLILKSKEFLIIAYRDLVNKKDIGDYFPIFFPSVKQKRAQIIYQNYIILDNRKDGINLYTDNLIGVKLEKKVLITSVSWDYRKRGRLSNQFKDLSYTSLNNRNFYVSSLQLSADNTYIEQTATPLVANYVPKTVHMLDIPLVQETIRENIGDVDWSLQVNEILKQICNLSIPVVQQFVSGNYNKGELCFVHDAAGNYLRTELCRKASANAIIGKNLIIEEVDTSKGKDELSISEIRNYIVVYPNPTSGILKVSLDEIIRGKIVKLDVYSATGASILTKKVTVDESELIFDITIFPTGVYILKFKLSTGESFNINVIKR